MSRDEQWQISLAAAEAYERYVARYILSPWVSTLVDAAALACGEHVLDVACGTGVVARAAAERVGPEGRVTGIDLNPAMIAVARTVASPGAPIEWIERSALDLGLPDASIDAVLCQQGLQFFPDQALAMCEMRRVLRPGGRVALSVWNSVGPYNKALADALARFAGKEIATRFCASRRSPPREALAALARDAGFRNVDLRVARIEVHLPAPETFALDHLAATPVAPEIARLDGTRRADIGSSVMTELAAYHDCGGITYPEETYVLTAVA